MLAESIRGRPNCPLPVHDVLSVRSWVSYNGFRGFLPRGHLNYLALVLSGVLLGCPSGNVLHEGRLETLRREKAIAR